MSACPEGVSVNLMQCATLGADRGHCSDETEARAGTKPCVMAYRWWQLQPTAHGPSLVTRSHGLTGRTDAAVLLRLHSKRASVAVAAPLGGIRGRTASESRWWYRTGCWVRGFGCVGGENGLQVRHATAWTRHVVSGHGHYGLMVEHWPDETAYVHVQTPNAAAQQKPLSPAATSHDGLTATL